MFKVAFLGDSGYTGLELVSLNSMHTKFEIVYLSGDSKSGMKFGDVYPGLQYLKLPNLLSVSEINYEEIDVVFCALPHTKSAHIINNLPTNIKIKQAMISNELKNLFLYNLLFSKNILTICYH